MDAMKRCSPSGKSKDSSRVLASVQSRPLLALNSTTKSKPRVPATFGGGWLVLHWGHTLAIMCIYGDLRQQMYEKSSLLIISAYRRSSCSGHISDALGKTKKHIDNTHREEPIQYKTVKIKSWLLLIFSTYLLNQLLIIKSHNSIRWFIEYKENVWLLLSINFTEKGEMVFVLTQENCSS